MRTGFRRAIVATVATNFLLPAIAAATEPQIELQRNPFARPAPQELIANSVKVMEDRTVEQAPGLRAVLVAGSKSVVNIGGVILQIGECTDAFCLLSVEEGKALIRRNDKEIVLSLYEQDKSEER